jgi:hypothetical protein
LSAYFLAEALKLAQGTRGWTYYLTPAEVAFEVLVRLVFAARAGILAGSVGTAILTPFLWHFESSHKRIVDGTTNVVVILVLFLDTRLALIALITSWQLNLGHRVSSALLAMHFLIFVVALCIPRSRKEVLTSIDGLL